MALPATVGPILQSPLEPRNWQPAATSMTETRTTIVDISGFPQSTERLRAAPRSLGPQLQARLTHRMFAAHRTPQPGAATATTTALFP